MTPLEIPDCTHRPTCPGCPRYGEPGLGDAAVAGLRALAEGRGATLEPVVEGNPLGYRHRARLMVRGRLGAPKIGLFQAGSHRIADTPRCHVQHPRINEAAAALKLAMRSTQAEPYADAAHRGLVRAMQVVVERRSQRVQVVLITNSSDRATAEPLLDALRRELRKTLYSLHWNGNPARANTILGPHWSRYWGPEAVCETVGGASVFFPPGAFGQSHLELADRIVSRVHAEVAPGLRVSEFYAGCGSIGLGLLERGHAVAFNEISEASLRGLELGLKSLEPEARKRARVLAGSATKHAEAASDCDVLIVDPPRKGLDTALCTQLVATPPATLLYVSCDVGSLLRDAERLVAGKQLRLKQIVPYALFPFTEHVETLAIFERA